MTVVETSGVVVEVGYLVDLGDMLGSSETVMMETPTVLGTGEASLAGIHSALTSRLEMTRMMRPKKKPRDFILVELYDESSLRR